MNLSFTILQHAETIIRSFEIEPKPLDNIVSDYYKRHREINSKDRRAITELVFGFMRWKRRIEAILKADGIKPTIKNSLIKYFSFCHPPNGCHPREGGDPECSITLDSCLRRNDGIFDAEYWSYPDFLYEKFIEWKGKSGAEKIAEALNHPASVVIRANTLKTKRDELKNRLEKEGILSEPTISSPYGLVLKGRFDFNSLLSFKEGLFEIQDEGSQLAALLVKPKEDERILDLCAGSGGKTLMLAMLMGNKGRIAASDIDKKKLKNLSSRIKKAGIKNVEIAEYEKLKERFKNTFDAVLIDAPCSGSGTVRRNPDLKWRLTEEEIDKRIETQKKLLDSAIFFLKPGGRIIYITCSVICDENEKVVDWFVKKYPWKIVNPLSLNIPPLEGFILDEKYFRTDPSLVNMDGFFGAILTK